MLRIGRADMCVQPECVKAEGNPRQGIDAMQQVKTSFKL